MAAFEAISALTIRPHDRDSFLDFRSARLPSVKSIIDDYDPREHRTPRDPIKMWMAYFNLLRTSFGPGMLGLPLAISQGGIILGPILTMAIGIIVMHMHATLLWCLNEISKQLRIPYISYRYGFRIALLNGPAVCQAIGHRGPTIIAVFMILSQIGICTVFVIFTTDSLRDIMDWQSSKPAILALLLPYIFLESFAKSLKIVSYISMMDFVPRKNLHNPTTLTKRYGVLNISMFLTTLFSTTFGALGYWAFGTMEENVLRSLPYDDNSTMAAIGLYLIAIIFAYPLQCYPAIQIFMEVIKNHTLEAPSDGTLAVIEYYARPTFVLITFVVCYFIPFQGPFVAFVGNLCTTMLALVFPALMELCLLYPGNYGKRNFYFIKDIAIITIGLVCWVFGVMLCGYLIYVRILAKLSPNDIDYF